MSTDIMKHRDAKTLHGNKVKLTLRFRGREMAHQELGVEMLKRVRDDLAEEAVVEQMPKMEGRQMTMMMNAKKA